MDVIPYARFILSLAIGGLLIYLFNNVIGMIYEYFPNASQYSIFIFMLWHGLVYLVIIIEAIKMIMTIQRRTV